MALPIPNEVLNAKNKTGVVKIYRKKYPKFPSAKLARIIYENHSDTWDNAEQIRSCIRALEGKMGVKKRVECKKGYADTYTEQNRPSNPYYLPKSDEESFIPYHIKGHTKGLILNDIHLPYHSIEALTACFDYAVKEKPDFIFLNGDIIDCHLLSYFMKNPTAKRFSEELDMLKDFIGSLKKIFKCKIYFKFGNHCHVAGTEVLTSRGFIDFKDILETDKIAQFDINTKELTYATPLRFIEKEYDGLVYEISNGYSKQKVTAEHNVVLNNEKVKANEVTINDCKLLPTTGYSNNQCIDIKDDELRFIVNLVCDGCISLDKKYAEKKMRFQFKLSKQRKIDNLKGVLDRLGWDYSIKECKKTGVNKLQPYYIRIYKNDTILPIYNLLGGKKEIPDWFKKLNKKQAKIVVDEISITDGHFIDNSCVWKTTNKKDLDVIQIMCLHNGLHTTGVKYTDDKTGFSNGKQQYRLKIRYDASKKYSSIKKESYIGKVYCVTMPLGTVVTRYEGNISMSGNCERYDNFLFQKAGELKGVDEFALENIIKARCPDVEIIRDKRIVVINGLPFIHGHEYGRGVFNPVNAARGLFLQTKHSAVKGDCHTTSEHTEPDIFGKIMTTYSVGCLCVLTPKWLPLNKWNHGFAIIECIGTKEYKFRNYRIYKGKVL